MQTPVTTKRFVSRLGNKRVGNLALSVALFIVWSAITINLAISAYGVFYGASWGFVNSLLTVMVAAGMYQVTARWVREKKQKYYLVIEGDILSLFAFDSTSMTMSNQKISLQDVTEAEYYKPRETSSLILSTPDKLLDIPLWSFRLEDELAIVNHIRRQGVPLIALPCGSMPF